MRLRSMSSRAISNIVLGVQGLATSLAERSEARSVDTDEADSTVVLCFCDIRHMILWPI